MTTINVPGPGHTAAGHGPWYQRPRPWIAMAAVVLAGLLVVGAWPRVVRSRQLADAARANGQARPVVTVAPVTKAPAESELELPGDVQALAEAPVFARADGYVARRLVDIGDRVRGDQLLVEIDSPELDEQIREAEATRERTRASLRQAEAMLTQTQANLGLAEATARRWIALADKGVLSQQDGDEKRAALEARRAETAASAAAVQATRDGVSASDATVQRLAALRAFRLVRAPFDGVVTARNVDVGSLVTSGSTPGRELFRIAQISTLRVFVMVPQADAALMAPGVPCTVHVQGHGGDGVAGVVTRTANALDAVSRTLRTEVQITNPSGRLLPGSYATVRFQLRRPTPPVLAPSMAVRQTEQGAVVAVLTNGHTIHLQAVTLGRDLGTQIEVTSGLAPGQRVVTTWTDAVKEGAQVEPAAPAATPPARRPGGARP